MVIPWQELEPETLLSLIEHFILREGTDYGEEEITLTEKIKHVQQQLETGKAIIVFSESDESINIQAVLS